LSQLSGVKLRQLDAVSRFFPIGQRLVEVLSVGRYERSLAFFNVNRVLHNYRVLIGNFDKACAISLTDNRPETRLSVLSTSNEYGRPYFSVELDCASRFSVELNFTFAFASMLVL
jgi:hypothetical protein